MFGDWSKLSWEQFEQGALTDLCFLKGVLDDIGSGSLSDKEIGAELGKKKASTKKRAARHKRPVVRLERSFSLNHWQDESRDTFSEFYGLNVVNDCLAALCCSDTELLEPGIPIAKLDESEDSRLPLEVLESPVVDNPPPQSDPKFPHMVDGCLLLQHLSRISSVVPHVPRDTLDKPDNVWPGIASNGLAVVDRDRGPESQSSGGNVVDARGAGILRRSESPPLPPSVREAFDAKSNNRPFVKSYDGEPSPEDVRHGGNDPPGDRTRMESRVVHVRSHCIVLKDECVLRLEIGDEYLRTPPDGYWPRAGVRPSTRDYFPP